MALFDNLGGKTNEQKKKPSSAGGLFDDLGANTSSSQPTPPAEPITALPNRFSAVQDTLDLVEAGVDLTELRRQELEQRNEQKRTELDERDEQLTAASPDPVQERRDAIRSIPLIGKILMGHGERTPGAKVNETISDSLMSEGVLGFLTDGFRRYTNPSRQEIGERLERRYDVLVEQGYAPNDAMGIAMNDLVTQIPGSAENLDQLRDPDRKLTDEEQDALWWVNLTERAFLITDAPLFAPLGLTRKTGKEALETTVQRFAKEATESVSEKEIANNLRKIIQDEARVQEAANLLKNVNNEIAAQRVIRNQIPGGTRAPKFNKPPSEAKIQNYKEGGMRTAQAFNRSGGQAEVPTQLTQTTGFRFELGDFGRNALERKAKQNDRFPVTEISRALDGSFLALPASRDPINWRVDNTVFISQKGDSLRAVYVRPNAREALEVINAHEVPAQNVKRFLGDLGVTGIPSRTRTGSALLEPAEFVRLTYGDTITLAEQLEHVKRMQQPPAPTLAPRLKPRNNVPISRRAPSEQERFSQLQAEASVLDDTISRHPAAGYTKRFTENGVEKKRRVPALSEYIRGESPSLEESFRAAQGTKKKVAGLDRILSERGYNDLAEADEGIEQLKQLKQRREEVRKNIQEMRQRETTTDPTDIDRPVTRPLTEAERIDRRRRFVKDLRDRFGLDDADLKKINNRDIRLMSNYEFRQFLDGLERRAIELADTRQAKAELMSLLEHKEFRKVENYRKAMKLPPVNRMTASQLRKYAAALEAFQTGDEFLSVRTLETIDRTSLQNAQTAREVREQLLQEARKIPGLENVTMEELQKVDVGPLTMMRYDTALAELGPFFRLMVERTQTHLIGGDVRFLKLQNEFNDLVRKAERSRQRGLVGRTAQTIVPTHENIIRYLEAPVDQKMGVAKDLTPEEMQLADFISSYYDEAYQHLVTQNELYGSEFVDEYFTHTRKTFLENWKDHSLLDAFRNAWRAQKEERLVMNIVDDTGKVLPKSKFFQYTIRRVDEEGIEPSQNLSRVFLQYARTFERKRSLDQMVPEISVYTQVLKPKEMTKQGLDLRPDFENLVNQYLNTKRGRVTNFGGAVPQFGVIDIGLRSGNTLMSVLDLGGNIGSYIATFLGDFMMTYQSLGMRGTARGMKRRIWDTGVKRLADPNANKILKQSEAFIGRNVWTELAEPNTDLGRRFMLTILGPFSQASVEANKIFLLASITDAELKAGKLTAQRMARMRLEAGRWRDMGRDVKSIIGATSVGQTYTKYKGWAIPIARTSAANLWSLVARLNNKGIRGLPETLTTREAQETARTLMTIGVLLSVGSYVLSEEDDKTFIGRMKARAYQEAQTLLGGLSITTFVSTPRLTKFLHDLADAIEQIVIFERYEQDGKYGKEGDLKGVGTLKRLVIPAIYRQFMDPQSASYETKLEKRAEIAYDELERMTETQAAEAFEEIKAEDPFLAQEVADMKIEQDAEEAYARLKAMPTEDAAEAFDQLPVEVRRLVREFITDSELDDDERALKRMGVRNGERALSIIDELNDLETQEEKAALWDDYVNKKIITDQVAEQLNMLIDPSEE